MTALAPSCSGHGGDTVLVELAVGSHDVSSDLSYEVVLTIQTEGTKRGLLWVGHNLKAARKVMWGMIACYAQTGYAMTEMKPV